MAETARRCSPGEVIWEMSAWACSGSRRQLSHPWRRLPMRKLLFATAAVLLATALTSWNLTWPGHVHWPVFRWLHARLYHRSALGRWDIDQAVLFVFPQPCWRLSGTPF